jgi:hypothetical protein
MIGGNVMGGNVGQQGEKEQYPTVAIPIAVIVNGTVTVHALTVIVTLKNAIPDTAAVATIQHC